VIWAGPSRPQGMWVWAVKNGIFRICENGISRSNTGNTKTIGIQGKPFSTRFRICHPVFRIDSEFVRKYENEPIKCRNRSGTERDISRPFSTLIRRDARAALRSRGQVALRTMADGSTRDQIARVQDGKSRRRAGHRTSTCYGNDGISN